MEKISVIISGGKTNPFMEWHLSTRIVKIFYICLCFAALLMGLIAADYLRLRQLKSNYNLAITENQQLKGEAQILMSNLDDLKSGLFKVEEYASQLDSMIESQINNVKKQTGINTPGVTKEEVGTSEKTRTWPLGLSLDSLIFKPLVENMQSLEMQSATQAIDLQGLLNKINAHSSFLAALPVGKPVDGWITSIYGFRISPFTGNNSSHRGIDIAAPIGTPVYAPADGVVVFSGAKLGYGNFLVIAHGYGVITRYGHNSRLFVKTGQRVRRGDQISAVGDTGRSTGPHLHYEIWVNGKVVNPSQFMLGKFQTMQLR